MKNIPFFLVILDGWGVAPRSRSNAITEANTPVFNHILKNYWVETLQASGEAVGLPWGEMGNSEVGHIAIGAGKVVYQNLPRIRRAISDTSFFKNQFFLKAIEKVKKENGTLHLIGLISDGGVHSHVEHLDALLELSTLQSCPRIAIHAFLDGRDVGYNSALGYIEDVEKRISQFKAPAVIATVAGRFWGMDRDNHWDRIQKSYLAIAECESEMKSASVKESIEFYYKQGVFDEQIPPTVIGEGAVVKNTDSIIFFNFRPDRMRELVTAFTLPDFNKFSRSEYLKGVYVVTMTEYDKLLPLDIAFPEEGVEMPISRVLSNAGVRQLHIAETEKYAHVTYFFNGGKEEACIGEDRILVPSLHVSDYSEVPEMSAIEIVANLEREMGKGKYHFFVANFANADMVGHTGNLQAAIRAVEAIDSSLKRLIELILSLDGVVLITADHGNAEVMFDPVTGEINKEHTSNPVPCIIIGKNFLFERDKCPDLSTYVSRGFLSDVAPTILKIIGLPIPREMTGRPLI